MNNKAIETLSINAVRDSIVSSDYLDQFISDNDKEPTWDGNVYIYSDTNKKKDKLIGRMPVQVKGKENNDLSRSEISVPVDVTDLRNYLYDGGIVYFVVFVSNKDSSKKIYYSAMPPLKLRKVLEKANGNKTKNIKLKEFPEDNIKKANIFVNCYKNCSKQSSFVDVNLYSLEDLNKQGVLESITTTVSSYGTSIDPQMALLTNEVYFYANIKGSSVPQPLNLFLTDMQTITEEKADIRVNGDLYYNFYTRIKTKDSTIIEIGKSFRMIFNDGSPDIKIDYKNSEKLRILVKDLDFMLAILDAGKFEINNHSISFDNANLSCSSFEIADQKKLLLYHKKMLQMFNLLCLKNDIDLSKLTPQEWSNINLLITAFIDKKAIKGLKDDLSPFYSLEIADLRFALAFIHYNGIKDTYNIFDFFKTKFDVFFTDDEGKEWETSQFVILKANDFLEFTNIRFDTILSSYQSLSNNPHKFTQANNALLNILLAYDISKGSKPALLKAASDFAEWLMKSNVEELPYEILSLNRLQVIRRLREYNIDEIKELCSITENSSSREDVLVGAYLLLGNQLAAKIHFEKLDLKKQEEFKMYPIYHFWTESKEQ